MREAINEIDPDKFDALNDKLIKYEEISDRIEYEIASYLNEVSSNEISQEAYDRILFHNVSLPDEATGLRFRPLGGGPCINLNSQQDIRETLERLNGSAFIGTGSHEQYFYPDYFAYQKNHGEKLLKACEIMNKNGYEFVFAQDLIDLK